MYIVIQIFSQYINILCFTYRQVFDVSDITVKKEHSLNFCLYTYMYAKCQTIGIDCLWLYGSYKTRIIDTSALKACSVQFLSN